jgi:hypothetical protein
MLTMPMVAWLCLTGIDASGPSANLLHDPSFEQEGSEGLPDGWKLAAPYDAVRPQAARTQSPVRSGRYALRLQSTAGYRFGYCYQDVPLTPGKTYELVVRYRCEGIDNPNRCVLVDVLRGKEGWDTIFVPNWKQTGAWFEGRQKFVQTAAKTARVRLFLRVNGPGAVIFDDLELRESTPDRPRMAKVASYAEIPTDGDSQRRAQALVPAIARAAQAKCDIVCLTEGLNARDKNYPDIAEPIPGPMSNVLAQAAHTHRIYVIGCIYERQGDYVYNTAFLLDRQGKLVGKYRKTHLHFPEMFDGVRPGDEYPVFDCDFGRIGIEICYDSWFPEVARILALKGAEIIFCPNAGYHETCQAGRCCDNGVYFVPASHNRVNVIWDPAFHELARGGRELLMAAVELSQRNPYTYHQWQTNGLPQAFRQLPHTLSDRWLDELRELYRTIPTRDARAP